MGGREQGTVEAPRRAARWRIGGLAVTAVLTVAGPLAACGSGGDGAATPATVPSLTAGGHDSMCDMAAPAASDPTAAERRRLDRQLGVARLAAELHPTVADALAAGYKQADGPSCAGVHLVNWSLMDSRFDIAQPEMLLASGDEPTDPVIALSYYVVGDGSEPAGFAGGLDHFHRHEGMCIRQSDDLVLAQGVTAKQCRALGGTAEHIDGWMLHVWPLPGWANPNGTFAVTTPKLDADGNLVG